MVAVRSLQRPGSLGFGVVNGRWISRHDDEFDESIAANPLLSGRIHNGAGYRLLVGLQKRTSRDELSIYYQPRWRADGVSDYTHATKGFFDEDHDSVHKPVYAIEHRDGDGCCSVGRHGHSGRQIRWRLHLQPR